MIYCLEDLCSKNNFSIKYFLDFILKKFLLVFLIKLHISVINNLIRKPFKLAYCIDINFYP